MGGVDHAVADESGHRDAGGIDEYFQCCLLRGLGCRLFGIVFITGRAVSGHRGVGLTDVGLVVRCCVVERCCVAVCLTVMRCGGVGWCGGAVGAAAVAGEVVAGEALDVGEGGDAASTWGAWVIRTESLGDECRDSLRQMHALFGG